MTMRDEEKFTIFDGLMQQLEDSLEDGSLQVGLKACREEVNLDLMAIAHLQTSIAARVVILAGKLLNLPCEIRDSVMEHTGFTSEKVQQIVQKGGEITPAASLDAALVCLECVMRSMEQQAGTGEKGK